MVTVVKRPNDDGVPTDGHGITALSVVAQLAADLGAGLVSTTQAVRVLRGDHVDADWKARVAHHSRHPDQDWESEWRRLIGSLPSE